MKTSSTVPGQMVINVLSTNRVLKLMRFRAPILLEEASVKSLEWSSITRQIRYSRKNMGSDKVTSYGTHLARILPPEKKFFKAHRNWFQIKARCLREDCSCEAAVHSARICLLTLFPADY